MQIAVLFFLSGLTALIYELTWTRWLGLIMGNFMTATSVILAVFMTGLAIGSAAFGRLASRLSPAGAVRLYAVLEGVLAVLAGLSPLLLSTTFSIYSALARAAPLLPVRIAICAALMLVPTVLMGGTLPALVRGLSAVKPRLLGPLYAFNTAGAACGPLLAAFILMPAAGMLGTIYAACAVNLTVAFAAWRIAGSWEENGSQVKESVPAEATEPPRGNGLPYALAFISGMLALGAEVALSRQTQLIVTGSSVYGFAIVLSAFLIGMALGAGLAKRLGPRDSREAYLGYAASMGLVFLSFLTTPFWDAVPAMLVETWMTVRAFSLRMVLNYLTVSGLVLVPAVGFGYALPGLAAALSRPGAASIGRLFALNTVGAALGALLAGFVLIPELGLAAASLSLGGASLLAGALALSRATGGIARVAVMGAAVLLLAALFLTPRPDGAIMNAGFYNRPHNILLGRQHGANTPREVAHAMGRIIFEEDGFTGHIAVRAMGPGRMAFIVNGKPDGSTSDQDLMTQILSAHLGLFLHPDPRKVLLVGLGTGISAGSLSRHAAIEELEVAEIEPVQLKVAGIFSPQNYAVLQDPRVKIHVDDARHVLMVARRRFDVIISEPSNLFVSGMVNLYTREFFESVRDRLSPGGVFLTFVHYYQVNIEDLKGIFLTFQKVFPESSYWLHGPGDSMLVGVKGKFELDAGEWVRRGALPAIRRDLMRVGIGDALEMARFYLWGPQAVANFASGGRMCTDNLPYPEFSSPRVPWDMDLINLNRKALLAQEPSRRVPLKNEDARLRLKLGRLFMSEGRLARAKLELQRALELDPGLRDAAEELARSESF